MARRSEIPNRTALYDYRQVLRMSKETLATKCGVSRKTIDRFESGDRIDREMLERLARGTGMPVDQLINPFAFDWHELEFDVQLIRRHPNRRVIGTAVKRSDQFIADAIRAELEADFSQASELYISAKRVLAEVTDPPDALADHIRTIESKVQQNQSFASFERREAGSPEQVTLIPCFRENGQKDFLPKDIVHQKGYAHSTVILLPRSPTGCVGIYERHPLQTYAGRFDAFGGHVRKDEDGDAAGFLTAVREGNEELIWTVAGLRLQLTKSDFKPIGEPGQFAWPIDGLDLGYDDTFKNVEKSSVFVVELTGHPAMAVTVRDEDASGRRIVKIPSIRWERWPDLVERFHAKRSDFADGLARVLHAYGTTPQVTQDIDNTFSG